jgi:hypothetical protein
MKRRCLSTRTDLDWACVYDSLLVLQCQCDCILGDNGLSCASVRRNENALISLDGVDGNLLKGIEGELVLARRFCWGNMGSDRDIRIVWWYGNLMSNLELAISRQLKE